MRDCCMVREINLLSLIPCATTPNPRPARNAYFLIQKVFAALDAGFRTISDRLVTKKARGKILDHAFLWKVFIDFFPTQNPHQFNSFVYEDKTYSIFAHSDPVGILETGQFFTG
jgi:hypothetical protein